MKRLQHLQETFSSYLLEKSAANATHDIFSTEVQRRADRVAIYRGNLLAIWTQALANAYPVIQRLVGSDFFEELARAYGRQFPSQSGDLNDFGAQFPIFLEREAAVAEYPYFAHVARLEWLLHLSYYAADAHHLSLHEFIAQAGEALQQARLQFHPGVSLYASNMASVPIWLNHQHDEVVSLTVPVQSESFAVVVRPDWTPQVLALEMSDYLALKALANGETIEVALEQAVAHNANFDIAARLRFWFGSGIFSAANIEA